MLYIITLEVLQFDMSHKSTLQFELHLCLLQIKYLLKIDTNIAYE